MSMSVWNRLMGNNAEQVLRAIGTTPGWRSHYTANPDAAPALAGRHRHGPMSAAETRVLSMAAGHTPTGTPFDALVCRVSRGAPYPSGPAPLTIVSVPLAEDELGLRGLAFLPKVLRHKRRDEDLGPTPAEVADRFRRWYAIAGLPTPAQPRTAAPVPSTKVSRILLASLSVRCWIEAGRLCSDLDKIPDTQSLISRIHLMESLATALTEDPTID